MSQYSYFEFKWIETEKGQTVNQGTSYYFTSDLMNYEEMKNVVRISYKKPHAVITIIPEPIELDRETYLSRGVYAPPA